MTTRGIVNISIGGLDFELVPSFENLDRLETVLNRPCYEFLAKDLVVQKYKVGDIVRCILACGSSRVKRYPEWWSFAGIGEQVLIERGKAGDLSVAIATFIGNAISAGSETDIKTVGATDEDVKK